MHLPLAPAVLVYLTLPPLLWASNAVIGRLAVAGAAPLISPVLLNALRWVVALGVLVAIRQWRRRRDGRGETPAERGPWWVIALFGLVSVAAYNALQYLALKSSTAINVTLIASGGPLFVLGVGRLFFGAHAGRWAWTGAAVSLAGVGVVLTGGDLGRLLALHFLPGDLLMIGATIAWAFYSWLLRLRRPSMSTTELLLQQVAWGLLFCAPAVAGEWLADDLVVRPTPATAAIVVWIALGPALLAFWCWDRGIAGAGPVLPTFFTNLTPLFAALMSALWIGEAPQPFHVTAFALIIAGIALSQLGARRQR